MSSIDKRIKVFNKLYKEFHDNINNSSIKFSKITKYLDLKGFKDIITENISYILQKDLNIFTIKQIKLLYKYQGSHSINNTNKDTIFTFIKNMYYTTLEDKEEADRVKELLSLEIDANTLLDFFNNSNNGLMKIITDMAHEILPEVESLDIKNVNKINIQDMIQNILKGDMDIDSIHNGLDTEDKEKIKKVIEIIKVKVEEKISSGAINKNMLKEMMKYINKGNIGKRV